MTPEEMDQVRPRLVAFAAEMLGGLPRSDQRATGELYLRGLMLEGKRKSMQPMAARLGVDHQRLQQFLTSSTWDHVEVRERLARWADAFIDPDAYVIDDTGFPKDGAESPGVARMYSGTLGKVGNCQIGVSEVFSPEIRAQLKGPVGAAGQGCNESLVTCPGLLGAGSRPAALDPSLAQGSDLRRCL